MKKTQTGTDRSNIEENLLVTTNEAGSPLLKAPGSYVLCLRNAYALHGMTSLQDAADYGYHVLGVFVMRPVQ